MQAAFNNEVKAPNREEAQKVQEQAITPKKKRGRPKGGKSSNPDYVQTSIYLKKDTLESVRKKLFGTKVDMSELCEDYLTQWLDK